MLRRPIFILGCIACLCGFQRTPTAPEFPPGLESALDRIHADGLRAELSFLASDLLEGRKTPSRGLDIAAEYIAAEFRLAGLEPASGGSYFQAAKFEEPQQVAATVRNVIGLLRGSDTALKDTYVLLTAHYDHVGMLPPGSGDRIFNGANDNASGTVSMLETARKLALVRPRPRRSIVFIAFFGEEEGLVGSRFYASHPIFPIEKTVAQVNLEQLGRTDSTEGPQVNNATLTGFDYSDVTAYFQAAAEHTGIRLYKHPRNSDRYFRQSDNAPLAEAGVPAHTLAVTFDFPDYHGVGDEWQKIDYENMAKIDRMLATAIFLIANSGQAPQWNESNPRAAKYLGAWQVRHKPQ